MQKNGKSNKKQNNNDKKIEGEVEKGNLQTDEKPRRCYRRNVTGAATNTVEGDILASMIKTPTMKTNAEPEQTLMRW